MRMPGSVARPFGLTFSTATSREIATLALTDRRRPEDGVALVVTPNIDHIAWLRRSPALVHAYARAAAVVCDGWPVQLYARALGVPVRRVTGCELASEVMRGDVSAGWQRFFFVADRADTEAALKDWAAQRGVADRMASFVPPFGFENDDAVCRDLAARIRAHGTTLLLMGVGAPRSEVFVDRYRDLLPPCWAFCVGQAIKVELRLVRRAPRLIQVAGMEWAWRLAQEPRRLAGRYCNASVSFALAVLEDRRRGRREARLDRGGVA